MLRSWRWRLAALAEAVIFTSGIVLVEVWLILLFVDAKARGLHVMLDTVVLAVLMSPVILLVAIPATAIGIAIAGVPGWALLHHLDLTRGWLGRMAAALVAVVASAGFVMLLPLASEPMTSAQQAQALLSCSLVIAPAMTAAWVIQRVAYDRPKPPRPSPVPAS